MTTGQSKQTVARRLAALIGWLRARAVSAINEGHTAPALARSIFDATKKDTETLEREALDRGPFTAEQEDLPAQEPTST